MTQVISFQCNLCAKFETTSNHMVGYVRLSNGDIIHYEGDVENAPEHACMHCLNGFHLLRDTVFDKQ